jgi:hypothetical protein
MAAISSQVTLKLNIGGVVADILMGAVKGQNLAAERLLALSAAEVPLSSNDGGTLMASGTTVPAEKIGDDSSVVYDASYAARWHEDKALVDVLGRHYDGNSNFQNGRKSHYVSDPALQNKAELGAIIAAEAKRGA